jgi:phage terminase small subunit
MKKPDGGNIKLTPKQKLFVKEYLIDFNATKAAIRAGYSKKTAHSIGSENLTKPEILLCLQNEVSAKIEKIDDLSDSIIKELKKIAFSDIKDFLSFNENGVSFHDSDDVDGTVISEVSSTETITGKDNDKRVQLKMKLHDKLKALELLGRYKMLFTDKQVNATMTFEEFLKQIG